MDASRREKLKQGLIRKLMSKYHPGIANSKTEALVHSEVDRLMTMKKVSEEDLHGVEAKVRKQSNDEIAFIVTNPFKRVTSHKSGAVDEWAAMNEMVVRAGMDAETRKQAARQSQKMSFKRQLDEQIAEAEARKAAERAEKAAESKKVLNDVQSYIQAMDDKKTEQARMFERMRKERELEMNDTKARQAKNRQQKKEEEQREIARVRKMQQDDYDKIMNKRKENMDKMKLWREENENNLKVREQLRQQQMQEDIEFARKAQAALDEQERKRLEDLHVMEEKMKARGKMGEVLGASMAAQEAEDEARMLKIQEEARMKAEAQFQEKIRREHQKKVEIRATLDRQVNEQQRKKQEERDAILKQSELYRKQARDAAMDEERRMQARRQAQADYRMQLEDQLRQDVKLRPARELMMSEVERKINKTFKPR